MLKPRDIGILGSITTFIGLLFLLISSIIGVVVLFIARILILLAFKDVARTTGNIGVFKDMFKSLVLGILAFMVFVIALLITSSLVGPQGMPETIEDLLKGGVTNILLLGMVIAWVLTVASTVYVKKAYDGLARLFNVRYFRWIGPVYIVSIVFVITGLGILIAFIGALVEITSWMHASRL